MEFQSQPSLAAPSSSYPLPTWSTSKQTQHTRTGLLMPNFSIGTSLLLHLLHSIRPQCRLEADKQKRNGNYIESIAIVESKKNDSLTNGAFAL